jgi:hypothetical protein
MLPSYTRHIWSRHTIGCLTPSEGENQSVIDGKTVKIYAAPVSMLCKATSIGAISVRVGESMCHVLSSAITTSKATGIINAEGSRGSPVIRHTAESCICPVCHVHLAIALPRFASLNSCS